MSDLRARLADALKEHQFWHANHSSIGSNAHCLCGLRPRDQSEWADHLADVLLSLPGITIVELPEPDEQGQWLSGDLQASAKNRLRFYTEGDSRLSASEAREIAAALLAAANAAEARQ